MKVYHFDAKTAFLNGELEEEIYMRQPPGFIKEGEEKRVCLLRKSIYGLKQSARVWNKTLHDVIIGTNLKQSAADHCLYTFHGKNAIIYILVYVDDIIITSDSEQYIKNFETLLNRYFKIENLGEVTNYLSIKVTRNKNYFMLDQESYINKVAEKFGLTNSKQSNVPINPSYHKDPCDELYLDVNKYRAAIGCLLYI